MDRISALGYVTDVNGHRVFVDENEASGVNGTDVPAIFLTGVQESIVLTVEAAGLVPTDADNTQLLQAIRLLIIAAFTGSLNFPGWMRLPNGVIIQMGLATLPVTAASATSVAVTFPTVFPNQFWGAHPTATQTANGGAFGPAVQALAGTTSGFIIRGDTLNVSENFTNSVAVFWFAIGK